MEVLSCPEGERLLEEKEEVDLDMGRVDEGYMLLEEEEEVDLHVGRVDEGFLHNNNLPQRAIKVLTVS